MREQHDIRGRTSIRAKWNAMQRRFFRTWKIVSNIFRLDDTIFSWCALCWARSFRYSDMSLSMLFYLRKDNGTAFGLYDGRRVTNWPCMHVLRKTWQVSKPSWAYIQKVAATSRVCCCAWKQAGARVLRILPHSCTHPHTHDAHTHHDGTCVGESVVVKFDGCQTSISITNPRVHIYKYI